MKQVSLSEARANIAELLDEVERGETLQISQNGAAAKEVWPTITEEQRSRARIAMEQIQEARKKTPRVTVDRHGYILRAPVADDYPYSSTFETKAVFALAQRHRLTFYDAAYLELAQRERIPLATLDQAIARAAIAEGVPLIGA